jgi:uncharacterized protein (DUF1501 family)
LQVLASCGEPERLDAYGATLARWFGVAPADLDTVFPNLAKFATGNLGFMG